MLHAYRNLLTMMLLTLVFAPTAFAASGDRATTPQSQANPRLEWLRKLGGRGYDSAQAVAIGVDGSIFVAAADQRDPRDFPKGQAPTVGRLLKLTSEGTLVWSRAFKNVGFEGIAADSSGAVYATGSRGWQRGETRGTDLMVLRLDKDGRSEWLFVHGATESAEGADLALSDDGSVYVVGTEHVGVSQDSSDEYESLVVLKLSEDGRPAGVTRIQDPNYRFSGTGVDIVGGTNLFVSGSRGPAKSEVFDFWNRDRAAVVARFDSRLHQRWLTVADPALVGRVDIRGRDVLALTDGALLVGSAGVTTDDDPSRSSRAQMLALRVDSSGKVVWIRRTGGPGVDAGVAVAALESGGFLVTGASWPGHGPYGSMAVWKLTGAGDRLWSAEFGRPVEVGRGTGIASRGGLAVVVGGLKNYGDPTQSNIAVARYKLD